MRASDHFAAALLDQLGVATLAVAPCGAVHLANSAARALLERGDILFIDEEERLKLRCGESQRRLAVALAYERELLEQRSRSFLIQAGKPASHCLVRVTALAGNGGQPPRLVTVVPMNELPPLDLRLLQSLYDLSPAEAKVADCLGLGQDVTACAQRLEVQPATVRAQLKAVFRKMSINRQQDLVRITTVLRLCAGNVNFQPTQSGG